MTRLPCRIAWQVISGRHGLRSHYLQRAEPGDDPRHRSLARREAPYPKAVSSPAGGLEEIVSYASLGQYFTFHSLVRLCTKSNEVLLLCATSVFSVSLWLIIPGPNSRQRHREQRLHREIDPEVTLSKAVA